MERTVKMEERRGDQGHTRLTGRLLIPPPQKNIGDISSTGNNRR